MTVIKQTLVKLWLFNFGIRLSKSHRNPNFGFGLLNSVRLRFLKTETEPTFGLPHIANVYRYNFVVAVPLLLLTGLCICMLPMYASTLSVKK
jgi:hypothetical protein